MLVFLQWKHLKVSNGLEFIGPKLEWPRIFQKSSKSRPSCWSIYLVGISVQKCSDIVHGTAMTKKPPPLYRTYIHSWFLFVFIGVCQYIIIKYNSNRIIKICEQSLLTAQCVQYLTIEIYFVLYSLWKPKLWKLYKFINENEEVGENSIQTFIVSNFIDILLLKRIKKTKITKKKNINKRRNKSCVCNVKCDLFYFHLKRALKW